MAIALEERRWDLEGMHKKAAQLSLLYLTPCIFAYNAAKIT